MQCFFPKYNTFPLSVTLLDDVEKLFKISVNEKASVTLCHVAKSIPVTFVEYFGLKYFDRFQKAHWINSDKSLYKQLKKSQIERPSNVKDKYSFRYPVLFEVRYYPRDPTSINDEHFRYQLFLQIRKDLTSNKLSVKEEKTLSLLCALILQSDFGDYDSSRFAPHYIRQTIPNHLLTPHIEDQIKSEHTKLRGVEPIEAEYQFLEKIRWLENYGTIIFPVKDSCNKNCYLGLNPQGFALRYYKENSNKCDIFWPRIYAIKRNGRQLLIKEKTEKVISHHFETGEKGLCKALYKLSLEHFAFFKLKKDEKPLVKEPVKRTFGKSQSKEFGYNSDTSDNNQYSDDTMSSYPDSINTTQSTKMTKVFKKTVPMSRNCVSDVEESALSRKNRKVIVCTSQTETEDDYNTNIGAISEQSKVYPERIPADYIYENRLKNPELNKQIRSKRLTKKLPPTTGNERRFHGHKELEPFLNKTISDPPQEETKYQIPFKNVVTRESGYQVTRRKSGDGMEGKARVRRKLPSTEILPYSSEVARQNEYSCSDQKFQQSTSVDSIIGLRVKESPSSPSKRILPNVVTSNPENISFPPIPKHQSPAKQFHAINPINLQNRPQSLYTDIRYKSGFQNIPPRIPQRNICSQRPSNEELNNDKEERARVTNKSYLNYVRRSIPETGI